MVGARMRTGAVSAGAVLLACAALGACVPTTTSTDAEQKVATGNLIACFQAAARRLDDGRSDALTIAIAMQGPCSGPRQQVKEVYGAGLPLQARLTLNDNMDAKTIETATTIVMEERRKVATVR